MARPTAWLLLPALLALSACATRPIVYPNQKLREAGQVAVEADTDACIAEAREYLESGRVPELAKQTAEGGVVGGAVGGAVGAVTSSVGRGAAAGAAGGAAGSLMHGLWHWNDPDPAERGYVEHCLRQRGYDVIGWR